MAGWGRWIEPDLGREALAAVAGVSPASATKHEQHEEDDQECGHGFLFHQWKPKDRDAARTRALLLRDVFMLGVGAFARLFTSEHAGVTQAHAALRVGRLRC